MLVRPGSADLPTLTGTFLEAFHLPERPEAPRRVLDLGANIGLTMAHYAVLYPSAQIAGVELDRENAELCVKNLEQFGPRCSILHAGVSAQSGNVSYLRESGNEWGFSIITGEGSGQRVEVSGVTVAEAIDHFFPGQDIDFVKFDIEGAEAEVLANGEAWAGRVRSLKVETHGSYSVDACLADLRRLGFSAERFRGHPSAVKGWRGDL